MAATGIDASRHQGTVDWTKVRAAGHDFAFLKATEGTSYNYTSWFITHAPRARAAGLVVGAYHFLRADRDPTEQARYFLSIVKAGLGNLRGVVLVVDVETAANGTKPLIGHLRTFAAEFRRLAPSRTLVVYTGRWYWVGHMGDPVGADIGPLWHSEYEATPADGPELDTYGGWTGATVWQWTSTGSVPGVSGSCDMNVLLRGSLADLTDEDDMTPEEVKAVLDSEARKVPGIVSWERYLEVLLEAARGARTAASEDKVDEAAIGAAVAQAVVPAVVSAILDQLPDDITVNLDMALLTEAAEAGAKQAFREGTG